MPTRDTSKGYEVHVRWETSAFVNMPKKRFLYLSLIRLRRRQLPHVTSPLVVAHNLAKGRRVDPKAGGRADDLNQGGNLVVTPPEIILLVWLEKMDEGSHDVVWVSCPRADAPMAKTRPHLVLLVYT